MALGGARRPWPDRGQGPARSDDAEANARLRRRAARTIPPRPVAWRPMATPAKKSATYEELLALPDTVIGQIVDGELVASPRPASPHTRASSILGNELTGPFDRGRGGPGGWWILDEPEIHLGRDVLVPDLAGWRRSRLPQLKAEPFFTVAPDWVCEVLSPGTRGVDRVR